MAFFYRDSNQNEVDVLLKQEGEITAIEVKSSMTYNKSFEKSLSQIDKWIQTPVVRKVVVYTGEFENTAGDIKTSLVISCYKDIILHLGMEWGRGMFKLSGKATVYSLIYKFRHISASIIYNSASFQHGYLLVYQRCLINSRVSATNFGKLE